MVALDVARLDEAARLVKTLSPHAGWFKVGSVLFTRAGADVCRLVKDAGAKLFLDLKFHDIPNTVHGAVRSALELDVDMLTLHVSGGRAMLEAAVRAREEAGKRNVLLVGVTVLTHFSFEEFQSLFASERPSLETIVAMAGLAKAAGLDGVVASALEASIVKSGGNSDFVVVTPGIRLERAGDDQVRVTTPRQAIQNGADYLVVGRPVIADADPAAACRRILDDMRAQ
jgi:orotidine-5'-phosphate decarboxylase